MGIGSAIGAARKRPRRWIAHGLAAMILGAALGGAGAAPAWPAIPKVTMLWVAVSGSQAVAWVTKEGGYFTRNGVDALSHWGLRPDTDVKIMGVGSVSAQIAALDKRLVQGAVVDPPNDVLAQQAGARLLARVSDLGIPYQAAGLVTTREYIQSRTDTVARVVRAMTQGVHRIKTDRTFSEEVMAKYLRNNNPLVVDAAYNAYVNIFPRAPAPTKAGLAEIVKEGVSTGQLKESIDVGPMLDTSFVDKLQASGFIQQLYSR